MRDKFSPINMNEMVEKRWNMGVRWRFIEEMVKFSEKNARTQGEKLKMILGLIA